MFISGTFDYTFGRALGASLYIDDIDVDTANGPEVVLEYIHVRNQDSAKTAIGILETANGQVAALRAYVGALQNRLSSAIENITARGKNQTVALGRINDADVTAETAFLVKQKVLTQSAAKMLEAAQSSKRLLIKLIEDQG